MRVSARIAQVCSELPEIMLSIRQSVPLTWHGDAADEFATRSTQLTVEIETASSELTTAAQLAHLHELRMQAMSLALRGSG